MYETKEELQALLGVAAESVSLEFKSGRFFSGFTKDPAKRTELIKDVTAFANAGGGALLYGIRERQEDGKSIADAFEPVPAGAIGRDQLTQVIHANTDPPLAGFRINMIDLDEGQVIVIEVDEGYTATQNKLDYLFYQRVEATNQRMGGYAIRDVMNRRTTPLLEAGLGIGLGYNDAMRHEYLITPYLRNVGVVTAAHWRFLIEIPAGCPVHVGAQMPQLLIPRTARRVVGQEFAGYEYSSERGPVQTSMRLLPGESISFVDHRGFPNLQVELTEAVVRNALARHPPLRWTVYTDNAQPLSGEVEFEQWCQW